MPTIVGTIRDSASNGVTGNLTVQLDAPIIDTVASPDAVNYGKPVRYRILNGALANAQRYNDTGGLLAAAAINLPATVKQTYTFSFTYEFFRDEYYLDGSLYLGDFNEVVSGTTPPIGFYTGAVYSASTSRPLTRYIRRVENDLFVPFSAKMPDTTNVEWASLQDSGINAENLDSSLYEVARLLSTTFSGSLVSNFFVPRGNWSNAIGYAKNSLVYYTTDKKVYWKTSSDATVGLLPTNTAHWMLMMEPPTAAAQTITLNDNFPTTAWDGNITQAPTLNVIWDTLALYRLISTSYSKAEVDSLIVASLSAFVPPAPTSVATPALYGANVNSPININYAKLLRSQWLTLKETKPSGTNGGSATTNYRTRLLNVLASGEDVGLTDSFCTSHNTSNGQFTLRAGRYLIHAYGIANRVNAHRIFLYNVTDTLDSVAGSVGFSAINANVNSYSFIHNEEINIFAAKTFELRHYIQTVTNYSDALGVASGAVTTEVYAAITIRKID